jgi:hypothetical protein
VVPPSPEPPSPPPLPLPLEEPVAPDELPLPPDEVPPELDPEAPHWHGVSWPVESQTLVPDSDPLHEHVSIWPGEHVTPAELLLQPEDASTETTRTAAEAAASATALMLPIVTRCNSRVTADRCHARCRDTADHVRIPLLGSRPFPRFRLCHRGRPRGLQQQLGGWRGIHLR